MRARLDVDVAAQRLSTFFAAATQLICLLARACGHDHVSQFSQDDLTTWKKYMAELTGIRFAGVA